MCGKVNNVQYPVPLQLYGVDLPWVTSATHLGHELHQAGNMDYYDARVKRAIFIENSIEIREMFWFAHPAQVLQAVNFYSCNFYGSMLWNLYGHGAGQVFRSWNTCVKLAWDVPRWSHNYLVDHVLASGVPSVRRKILGQYLGFFRKLLMSDSPEIRILANLAGRDVGSVTGANLLNIGTEFDLDPWTCSPGQFKEKYNFHPVPAEDEWRLPLLVKLLNQRMEMRCCDETTTTISELSLCYS